MIDQPLNQVSYQRGSPQFSIGSESELKNGGPRAIGAQKSV
jgi:hypothetical protein